MGKINQFQHCDWQPSKQGSTIPPAHDYKLYITALRITSRILQEKLYARINQAGGLYRRVLTEVMGIDWMQWGLPVHTSYLQHF